jgi:NitT/TauT family transport system ATP-binding protein
MTTSDTGATDIVLQGVDKRFTVSGDRVVHAVDSVTGEIPAGAFVSVVGPSGCGKSTLMSMIAGLERPTGGLITVGGRPVTGPSRDIGVVFQEDSTLPWRTALRNVSFGMEVAGVPGREAAARAREALALVGLEDFADERPHRLSGGMRQRLAIARTLAMRPRILLMDEPFGALDEQSRLILGAQLHEIWRTLGVTVLFITHSIDEAVMLSTEVWVMSYRPGRVLERIAVDLPQPRGFDVVGTPEFSAYTGRLWGSIRRESLQGFRAHEAGDS